MDTVRASTLVAMACLFAIGCGVGLIAARASYRGKVRFGLFRKPSRTKPDVLIPPGPAPRLIPSDSPNAKRATQTRTPVPRQPAIGANRVGMVDYIAAFASSEKNPEAMRVDYLLVADECEETLCQDSEREPFTAQDKTTR